MLYEKPNTWLFEKKWRGLFYGNCPYVLYVNGKPAVVEYAESAKYWRVPIFGMKYYKEQEALAVIQDTHAAKTLYRLEFRDKPATEEETA